MMSFLWRSLLRHSTFGFLRLTQLGFLLVLRLAKVDAIPKSWSSILAKASFAGLTSYSRLIERVTAVKGFFCFLREPKLPTRLESQMWALKLKLSSQLKDQ